MGIVEKYMSLDSFYINTTGNKILLNDLDEYSIEDIETVNKTLMTIYDSDVIDTVPKCDCGTTQGKYLIGKHCPECGTEVVDPQDQLNPILWMKKLDDSLPFINPSYWLTFRTLLHKKIDYLRWLTDTSYNPPGNIPPYIYGMLDIMDNNRSYDVFIENIEHLLLYLLTQANFKGHDAQNEINFLLKSYRENKDLLFSNYLPIVNKKLFVMENTSKGKFTNLAVSDMIDLVMMWIKVSSSYKPTLRKHSNATGTILSKLANLYYKYYETYISGKPGIFRKHVYSFRSHFTFRAVITSIPGKHRYDEIIVPWSIGVTAFRPHLLNKLLKVGYTYKKASALLFKAVNKYIPVIDEMLQSLITEAPGGKLYVLIQRNPSLLQSSAIKVNISKFSTKPDIYSVQMSIKIAKFMNADYDGDKASCIDYLCA